MRLGLGLGITRRGGGGAPPVPAAPSNVAVPTIDDTTPTVGQTLVGSPGAFSGYPTATRTYQWQSDTALNGVFADITGATSLEYTAQVGDLGNAFRLEETATNASGSASAISAATSAVVASPFTGAAGFLLDGDSITIGDAAPDTADGYPNYGIWLNTITGYPVQNIGVGGRKLEEMAAEFNSRSTGIYTGDTADLYDSDTCNVLIVNGGANDLSDPTKTATDLSGFLTDYCQKAQAAGFHVIVTTMTRRGGEDGLPVYATFNQWIRDNWASIADGFLDFANATDDNGEAVTNNAQWLYDGLHPWGSYKTKMADMVRQHFGLSYIVSDTIPAAFSFPAAVGAALGGESVSEAVQFRGEFNAPATITVTGGSYRVNGGSWRSAVGLIGPYDFLEVMGTASEEPETETSVVVTVGGVSATYSITSAAAASASINWDSPSLAGEGTFGDGDRSFTGSDPNWTVKSTDAAVTGKKVIAFEYIGARDQNFGPAVSSDAAALNIWNDAHGYTYFANAGLYSGGGQISPAPSGNTAAFVIDEPSARLWVTSDGVNFRGPDASFTRAQVEDGTATGYDISAMKAQGPIYVHAEGVFFGASARGVTILEAWPWVMPSGYTYLTA